MKVKICDKFGCQNKATSSIANKQLNNDTKTHAEYVKNNLIKPSVNGVIYVCNESNNDDFLSITCKEIIIGALKANGAKILKNPI